ncbi:MAG: AAA family ATPase [Muricauda sp.]|nr:AAA family ATPase [Allomuricauda sp.]MBA4744539.1 AAA family ATPase [Allomuricauda sp.]
MEKIFLKNYKGFKEQFVELKDVNFLVGENSTGKTSFLKIINLLSSPEFWYNYEFNNNEVELGYFEEILNKKTEDKYFQIGIEKPSEEDDNKNKSNRRFRVIFEFSEEKSVPILTRAKVQIEDYDVLIKFTKKQITYRTKSTEVLDFEKWALDFEFSRTYKRINIPQKQIPLSILIRLIGSEILKNDNEFRFGTSFGREMLYPNYKWLAPIRAKAKRTYESYKIKFSPEGDHIPSILRQILGNRTSSEKNKIISILESFGKDSNLFDKIEIRELGKKNSSPFEIIVKYKDIEIKLPNVGYGVSQSLPIVIEVLSTRKTCFSIQQPEVHLHPKAQSAFGSFLFNAAKNDNNKFIIETHSDFTINRLRYKLSSSKKEVEFTSKILFFERTKDGNKITNIELNKDGTYSKKVPTSYRDFFIDEELKLLEL